MKVSSSDPRAVRTRALLSKALMELVIEKSFASLTIRDVTERAGLHRTTFYSHYAGLFDLLQDCIRNLFGQMRSEIYAHELIDFQYNTASFVPFIESVFIHLEQYEKFYQAMLGKQGDPLFQVLFQELLSELIFEPVAGHIPCGDQNARFEMILKFFSTGFTGIASWWLEKGKPISAKQASQQIARDILPDYLRLIRNWYKNQY